MSLDTEGQRDAGSDITANCGHRWWIVCLFHRLAEGIWLSKWTRLIQITKETGTNWRDRKLSRNFYMEENVKIRLVQGETVIVW